MIQCSEAALVSQTSTRRFRPEHDMIPLALAVSRDSEVADLVAEEMTPSVEEAVLVVVDLVAEVSSDRQLG